MPTQVRDIVSPAQCNLLIRDLNILKEHHQPPARLVDDVHARDGAQLFVFVALVDTHLVHPDSLPGVSAQAQDRVREALADGP